MHNANKLLIRNLITMLEFVNFNIFSRRWICIFKFCIQTIRINRPRLIDGGHFAATLATLNLASQIS